MRRHASFFAVLLCLLIIPVAAAAKIESYRIVSQVEGGIVREELLVSLLNDGEAPLLGASLVLPQGATINSVRDTYGDLKYSSRRDGLLHLDIEFGRPVNPNEERLVIASLNVDLVSEKEGYSEYLLVFTPKQNIQEFEAVLKLPKDAELFSPSERFLNMAPEGEISKEAGRLVLTWREELIANEPAVFLARFKQPSFPWKLAAYGIAALIALSIAALAIPRWREMRTREKKIESLQILNERERAVLEEIVRNEGVRQAELMAKLGYTKSSLSKILSKLEARGLVRRSKLGKANRLYSGEKMA